MAKKYLYSDELVEHIIELQGEISSVPYHVECEPRPNKALERLHGDYIRAVSRLADVADGHPEFHDLLAQSVAFTDAYIWSSRHFRTQDRAELVAYRPFIGRLLLRGTSYEYRKED